MLADVSAQRQPGLKPVDRRIDPSLGDLQSHLEHQQAIQAPRLLHVEEEQVESLVAPLELPIAVFAAGAQLGFVQTVRVPFQMLADGLAGKRRQRLGEPTARRFRLLVELFRRRLGPYRLEPLAQLRRPSGARWPGGRRSRRCRESSRGDPAATCT